MKKYIIVLLHLGYWLMYLFSVSLILLIDTHGQKVDMLSPAFIGAIIPACIGFYVFYGKLFDNYLAKKDFVRFFLFATIVALASSVIAEIIIHQLYRIDKSFNSIFFSGLLLSFISLINGVLGLVLKGFISWYDDIRIKVELNKKNYEVELALIKAQINPHFLFNTINNIDMLIQKDAGKASEFLNKLSDMMRFMLYETKTEKISLSKELAYIEKYVELQRIRTSNLNYLKYEVKGSPENLAVEPMLFIPIIENAFKHTENKKTENAIKIYFELEKNKIHFACENMNSSDTATDKEHSGLGNELIQKRLSLLYPGRHLFKTSDEDGVYKVDLSLSI